MANNQSKSYQYIFCEVLTGDDLLIKSSVMQELSPEIKDKIYEIREKLLHIVIETAPKLLTPSQLEVFNLFLEGYDQLEIADALGINQGSVNKALLGNFKYSKKKGTKGIRYGGIFQKLKNHFDIDPLTQGYLKILKDLSS